MCTIVLCVFCFIRSKYAFRTEPSTDVNLNLRPHKIGIFVDYEKGQVQNATLSWASFDSRPMTGSHFLIAPSCIYFVHGLCLCPTGVFLQRWCQSPHLHFQRQFHRKHLPLLQSVHQQRREEWHATNNYTNCIDGMKPA